MKLVISNVGKAYKGDIWGLKEFSLELQPGVLGLLGPNGAGKTTLMNILATITKPTTGRVTWNGADIGKEPDSLRTVLGYLPQNFGIYPNLSAYEFLHYLAALKGLGRRAAARRIDELLELTNLSDVRKQPLGTYSGGMKQRVGVAQALLNDPQVLIVDEPTVGLDPEERARFRGLLSDLSGQRIVILSTHIVSDVEAVATDIVLLHSGRMLLHSTPEQLLQAVDGRVWSCVLPSQAVNEFRQRHAISAAVRRSDGVHVRVVADQQPSEAAGLVSPTLEDAYLYRISKARSSGAKAEADGR
jgi:ABC-2 type transport system ATP-binding protein